MMRRALLFSPSSAHSLATKVCSRFSWWPFALPCTSDYSASSSEASAFSSAKAQTEHFLTRRERLLAEQPAFANWIRHSASARSLLAQAEELDNVSSSSSMPLHGLALAVKANLACEQFVTDCSSALLLGHRPVRDSAVVGKLRSAGALVHCITEMDEFGMGSAGVHVARSIGIPSSKASSSTASTSRSIHSASVATDHTSRSVEQSSSSSPSSSSTSSDCDKIPRNPWSTQHVCGGSSAGSAAVVASGLVAAALGTDTGGSVRQPAAHCGVVGVRPSYGRCSRRGLVAYASSLDTPGVFARSVRSAATLLCHMSGPDLADSTVSRRSTTGATPLHPISVPRTQTHLADNPSQPLNGLVIGLPAEYNTRELDPSILKQWELAASRLRDAGAQLREVSLPHTRHALGAYYLIATAEASSNLARYDGLRYGNEELAPLSETRSLDEQIRAYRSRGFGDEVQRRLLLGTFVLSKDLYDNYFEKATRVRRLVSEDFVRVFAAEHSADASLEASSSSARTAAGVHVLLTPTTASTAPTLSEVLSRTDPAVEYLADVMTVPSALAGLPAISVPVGMCTRRQLPIGLQVIGRRFDESTMFAVAQTLEDVSGFKPLFAQS